MTNRQAFLKNLAKNSSKEWQLDSISSATKLDFMIRLYFDGRVEGVTAHYRITDETRLLLVAKLIGEYVPPIYCVQTGVELQSFTGRGWTMMSFDRVDSTRFIDDDDQKTERVSLFYNMVKKSSISLFVIYF
jgi:hypothetical protein